jgi:hypothetical protein
MAWFGSSAAQLSAEDKRADTALEQLEVEIADITEACAPVIVWSGGGLVKAADADAVRFGEHGGAVAATSLGGAAVAGGTALPKHPR